MATDTGDASGESRRVRRFRSALDIVASLSLVAAAAFTIWTFTRAVGSEAGAARPGTTVDVPTGPVSLTDAAILGDEAAAVVLLAFSDFECPYCARFARDTLPLLTSRYVTNGAMRIAFRHLPLASIHSQAQRAAEAAECARRQGRFWEMHDRLFADVSNLGEERLVVIASDIGLRANSFSDCMGGEAAEAVARDLKLAEALNAGSTPVFFLGVVRADGQLQVQSTLVGARPFSEFVAAIEQVGPRAQFRPANSERDPVLLVAPQSREGDVRSP